MVAVLIESAIFITTHPQKLGDISQCPYFDLKNFKVTFDLVYIMFWAQFIKGVNKHKF